jgi:hypothetical protein
MKDTVTDEERDEVNAELRRTIDDAEHASNCGRTSLCNVYTPIQYALSDARQARGAAAKAHDSACRAVNLLLAIQSKEAK